jgi:DNA-binding CsgD family transcriptional regulator
MTTTLMPASAPDIAPVDTPRQQTGGAQRHHNEGHGRRLTDAFEALEAFPALAESRNRLLRVVSQERVSSSDVVAAVESDVALVIAVAALANQVEGKTRGKVESVVQAVELLSPEAVQALASRTRTFDFFERSAIWDAAPERFRLHGVATQRAADRLATEAGYEHRDRLMVTALLHDIGKLVLMHAYQGYPGQVHQGARTPRTASSASAASSASTTRWSAASSPAAGACRRPSPRSSSATTATTPRARPPSSAWPTCSPTTPRAAPSARPSCSRPPARSASGRPSCARSCTTCPYPVSGRTRQIDPCPLSTREVEVLKRLAEGKVYKQIALELGLSTSTVRTHLHNIYGKLGAVDRAQAVLMAAERGWL